jgi:hypothetical protein
VAKRSRLDINRVAAAAVDAAFENERQPRRRFTGVKAVAAGAALATVARVAVKKAPGLLPTPPSLSDLTGNVRDRLAEYGWIDEEEPLDEEESLEEEPLDEEESLEEEPLDEAEEWDEDEDEPQDEEELEDDEDTSDEDDEWEDEDEDETDDDEPQGSGEDEPEEDEEDAEEPDEEEESAPALELGANGSDSNASGRAPDLMQALSGHRRPPVMRSGDRGRDPAAEPPEPPKKRQRKSSQSKSKSKTGGRS